ncbi:hypothetical protein Dimus_012265 [Dionaea muscipula]
MLISCEKVEFPSQNGLDSINSLEVLDGLSPNHRLSNLAIWPVISVDVNVVPEQQQKHEFQRMLSSLEDEIVRLRLKQKSLQDKIRQVSNKILDVKGSIRVFCRIRPGLSSDRKSKHEPVSTGPEKVIVRSVGSSTKEFEFDKVFSPNSTQEDVYVEVKPVLRSAFEGHNICMLAYGQTGTGKTFTMEGSKEHPGIVPRALRELFHLASLDESESITFSLSMLEVHIGNLKDLLAPRFPRRSYISLPRSCNLNVQTDPRGAVEVEGLTEVPIADFTNAIWWYNKGRRARSTSCTSSNDMSSRSHCLTRITIFRNHNTPEARAKVTKMWMVDLGGSERLLKTGAIGQTLDEGRAINLSLSALGDVIAALRCRRTHVPYRKSKLTQILRDSLGDGSKVLMLVHASPCVEDIGETICSMSFAKRARGIESNQELSEEIKKQRQNRLVDLIDQLREAEEEYRRVTDEIQKADFLVEENKKLFLSSYPNLEDQGKTASSATGDSGEVVRGHVASEKTSRRNSLPRFMSSTVASRQRQSEITATERILRSTMRSFGQVSCSQSIGHHGPSSG